MPKGKKSKSWFYKMLSERTNASSLLFENSANDYCGNLETDQEVNSNSAIMLPHTSSTTYSEEPTSALETSFDSANSIIEKNISIISSSPFSHNHVPYEALVSVSTVSSSSSSVDAPYDVLEPSINKPENDCTLKIFSEQKNDEPLRNKLAKWAIVENVPHSAVKKLLDICKTARDISEFNNLPSDPRTLLHTPRGCILKEVNPGLFYYFGISNGINKCLYDSNFNIDENVFEIAVNIDGLPISKSTSDCFWPILIQVKSIESLKKVVILVGLYYGKQKPASANELLTDFIKECQELVNSGLYLGGKKYGFKVKMLICDSPAKAYVCCVKSHAGYFSCTKCKTEGTLVNNILCFPQVHNLVKRTDIEFRNGIDDEYHLGTSILKELPLFNLVEDIILDYMHLVCLGVTKRLLVHKTYGWIFGKPPYKLPFRNVQLISDMLKLIKKFVPLEFSRKTRSIQECKTYKATEFRLLLLYTGPVIFKDHLKPIYYKIFMTFSVAISILIDRHHVEHPDMVTYAHHLLTCFVETVSTKYGFDFISHNVHNLLHLSDDVSKFGNLDNFSAFDFENYMQFLKKLLRKCETPLQQIVNRIAEHNNVKYPDKNVENQITPLSEHREGPLLPGTTAPEYKALHFKNFVFKLNTADCYVQLFSGEIVQIFNIAQDMHGNLVLLGKAFLEKESFFLQPCDSSFLGIFQVNCDKITPLSQYPLSSIKAKLFFIPVQSNKAVVFPLRHC